MGSSTTAKLFYGVCFASAEEADEGAISDWYGQEFDCYSEDNDYTDLEEVLFRKMGIVDQDWDVKRQALADLGGIEIQTYGYGTVMIAIKASTSKVWEVPEAVDLPAVLAGFDPKWKEQIAHVIELMELPDMSGDIKWWLGAEHMR